MSADKLTVSETRELLTESLSRAQDCAADLVREVSDRDETIAILRAAVRESLAADEALTLASETHDRTRLSGASMAKLRATSEVVKESTLRRATARAALAALVAIDGGAS